MVRPKALSKRRIEEVYEEEEPIRKRIGKAGAMQKRQPRCQQGHMCWSLVNIKLTFKQYKFQCNHEAAIEIKEYYRRQGPEEWSRLMRTIVSDMNACGKKRVTVAIVNRAMR